jgi:hypothetical protein
MHILYILESDLQFRNLVPPESQSFVDVVAQFNGTPIAQSWQQLDLEFDPDSMHLPLGDFPSILLSHIPVFSVRAAESLEPLLRDNGELLPIRCNGDTYFAFNVTSVAPGLSKNSDIVYFPSGRIMHVKNYIIEHERLTSAAIFKLLEVPLMNVFVSDTFLKTVQRLNLSGFKFKSVQVS